MNDKEYHIDLINRYFANELQEDELNLLSSWIKESEENKAIFEEHRKLWDTINKSIVNDAVDTDEEWNKINEKLFNRSLASMHKNIFSHTAYKSFMRVAAGFALIVTISFTADFLFNHFSTKKILANNTMMEYTLPDSSIVTLNNGSMEFKRNFKNRKLAFNGEAFFEVRHHAKNPFTITTGNLTIQDVGTEFYVNTLNQNDKITIILKKGSVMLYSIKNPDKKQTLSAGQKATFNKNSGEITILENADQNYLAWKTKDLVFNNMSLDEVVATLNKVYKCNIVIKNDALKQCKITSEFKEQPLHAVLEVLKATLNLTITHTLKTIEISGNGCK